MQPPLLRLVERESIFVADGNCRREQEKKKIEYGASAARDGSSSRLLRGHIYYSLCVRGWIRETKWEAHLLLASLPHIYIYMRINIAATRRLLTAIYVNVSVLSIITIDTFLSPRRFERRRKSVIYTGNGKLAAAYLLHDPAGSPSSFFIFMMEGRKLRDQDWCCFFQGRSSTSDDE